MRRRKEKNTHDDTWRCASQHHSKTTGPQHSTHNDDDLQTSRSERRPSWLDYTDASPTTVQGEQQLRPTSRADEESPANSSGKTIIGSTHADNPREGNAKRPMKTTRRPTVTSAPWLTSKATRCQGGKVEEQEQGSTRQHTDMCRSAPQHNHNKQ